MDANGFIEEVKEINGNVYIRGNATESYKPNVEYIKKYLRHVFYINQSYFVIVDEIELLKECCIDFLLHTMGKTEINQNSFTYNGKKACMKVSFFNNGNMNITQTDEFADVDEKEIHGLEKQWHIKATGQIASYHKLVTLIEIGKAGELNEVLTKTENNKIIFKSETDDFALLLNDIGSSLENYSK